MVRFGNKGRIPRKWKNSTRYKTCMRLMGEQCHTQIANKTHLTILHRSHLPAGCVAHHWVSDPNLLIKNRKDKPKVLFLYSRKHFHLLLIKTSWHKMWLPSCNNLIMKGGPIFVWWVVIEIITSKFRRSNNQTGEHCWATSSYNATFRSLGITYFGALLG